MASHSGETAGAIVSSGNRINSLTVEDLGPADIMVNESRLHRRTEVVVWPPEASRYIDAQYNREAGAFVVKRGPNFDSPGAIHPHQIDVNINPTHGVGEIDVSTSATGRIAVHSANVVKLAVTAAYGSVALGGNPEDVMVGGDLSINTENPEEVYGAATVGERFLINDQPRQLPNVTIVQG